MISKQIESRTVNDHPIFYCTIYYFSSCLGVYYERESLEFSDSWSKGSLQAHQDQCKEKWAGRKGMGTYHILPWGDGNPFSIHMPSISIRVLTHSRWDPEPGQAGTDRDPVERKGGSWSSIGGSIFQWLLSLRTFRELEAFQVVNGC
jgi:hypothetical protein